MARLTDLPYFTGRLLLAMPAIGDPRFSHAVIAMVSHDAEGAMGVAISETGDYPVSEILDQCGLAGTITPDPMVLVGGPVEPSRGFVLHSDDWGGEGTVDVAGKFAVSGSIDVLRAIASGKGPTQWLLAMGYAGWGPGQLEAEIAADAWHVTDIDTRILYELEPESRWAATMARDGIDPYRIVARGGTA
jgi:putative transcriptional regulator